MVAVAVTADAVAAAAVEVCPAAAPVEVRQVLRAGRAHRSWLLDSALGPVVVKVGLATPSPVALARLAEHRRAWEHGAPVPRLLGMASTGKTLGDRLVVVLEYLPGVDAEVALPGSSADRAVRIMHAAGKAVATLHAAGAETFGEPGAGHHGARMWAGYVGGQVELLGQAVIDAGFGADGRVRKALDLLPVLAEDVSPAVRPGLVHGDVYLPNLLVGEGDAVWLLDLEHLRWLEPVMDFVKPAMWMFDDQPAWADAFVAGYRSSGSFPARWVDRLAVAMGLELLTGLGYWVKVGDRAMGADYLSRLHRWVDAGGRADWPGGDPG